MSTMQHLGKGIIRTAKNYTKGYSDVQAKVREATSNDPWGPSGTQMNELAQLSYIQCVCFASWTTHLHDLRSHAPRRAGTILWRSWRCWISG